ncbi:MULTISPECIES: hypothetical protein [unclassified Streptomyces]|uniref:hypothetical protein n=1 Tax=unclassified Streptomyces TaxID=2593676 RepID=UPI0033183DCE
MTAVLALIHLHAFPDGSSDFKLVGVFSTQRKAAEAQAATVELPGFRDSPSSFWIVPLQVDTTPSPGDTGPDQPPGELHLLFQTLDHPERGELVKILGAFLSEDQARAALANHPGIPAGAELEVAPVRLDERTWTEGFVTVT